MFSQDLKNAFLNDTPFIDVRAPVEFTQGHLPKAQCLPILGDSEREAVGTTYKLRGSQAALSLGHQMISGKIKQEKISQWLDFKAKNNAAIIYCFRGGQRSAISQQWMNEAGCNTQRLEGGYKAARQFLIEQSEECSLQIPFLVLAGLTGSGKTIFLNEISSSYPTLDLESLAKHRGSAFGGFDKVQPSQATFENLLAVDLLKLNARIADSRRVLVEDESRMIGKRNLPTPFFTKLRTSPVLFIDVELEDRVENIYREYICETVLGDLEHGLNETNEAQAREVFENFNRAIIAISSRLGGLDTKELLAAVENAQIQTFKYKNLSENKIWIRKLLSSYYDPLYNHSLERRAPNIVLKAKKSECFDFLNSQKL